MITTIQKLLTETADVEREIAALEHAGKRLDTSDGDEEALIRLIDSLRAFAQRTRDATQRVVTVQHQVEARLTLMRDAKRAA